MGNLLGKAPNAAQKVSEHDRAVLELKVQRDKLKQYQRRMESVLEKEVAVAKQHLAAGDKKRAMLALKKKRYQEQLLEKSDAQIMNLEQLVNSIEYAVVEKQVLEGIKKGNDTLKQLNDQMRIEDVEKLMDDTADAIAYQKEVENLLTGQLSSEDDEAVMAELNQLEKEAVQAEVESQLPAVPTTSLPEQQKAQEEEKDEKQKKPAVTAAKTKAKQAVPAT